MGYSMFLEFPNKQIRAEVIKSYMASAGHTKCVCFSCGNASKALKAVGLDVLDISPNGVLLPTRWFSPAEVSKVWPGHFDATSGHLSLFLMGCIGQAYKQYLGGLAENTTYTVPTGSGETIICLKLAHPNHRFIAQYNINNATRYDVANPLNSIVKGLAVSVIGI